ncbi:hypothetical protein AS159_03370 [Thermotoga sp. Ku-13t]|uniref:hypothetical protein n=1 Tax=Thermotoga sp. Ku-13t TaxID=1755813 RepID=UPI0013EABBA1|nr:hypothetical protein [Thermotoga sp. Ku-13t]KAF2958729.1 hypothetical protein AS159_03370 [Thermotoga sp. Ku-13t]
MRKILLLMLLALVVHVFASHFVVSTGLCLAKVQGWNLSVGFLDRRFSVETGLTFDVGGIFSGSQFDMYSFEVLAKLCLYSVESFSLGPMVSATLGNFTTGESTPTWSANVGAGAFVDYVFENLEFSVGMMYPFLKGFDVVESIYVAVNFFLTPPEGKHFTDRFFVGMDLLNGRFRWRFGFVETF